MKKRLISLLLALALTPLCARAETEYVTLPALREQAQTRWTQTYQTKWRDVQIDAQVRVPDGDAMPLLLLGNGADKPLPAAADVGWEKLDSTPFWVYFYNERPTYPRKLDGERLNRDAEPREVYNSGFAPQNTYIPMSDLTFGEICDMTEAFITSAGYDASGFDFRTPTRLSVSHLFYYGYKKDALPGGICFDFRTCVSGVPVLSHIYEAVTDHVHGESRADEILDFPRCMATYDAYDGKMHNLHLWCAQPVETIAADVPLCPLDTVIAAIEPEITAGHIRKIYEVELGYVLYNEPGVYHSRKEAMVEGRDSRDAMEDAAVVRRAECAAARYYARPMWQINCLYVGNPGGSLRETASYTMDERNSLDYRQLLVDAQTGELVQESQAQDRCEFTGFVSWDDVK